MRNKLLMLSSLLFVSVFVLTGCNGSDSLQMKFNNWLGNRLIEKSGVAEDENYIQAQKNGEEGLLDENGRLVKPVELETDEIKTGSVHLTFAKNNNISVVYYYDKERTQIIDTSEAFLNPGDSIYVSGIEVNSSYSDHYVFLGFKFIEYDQNGKRKGETNIIKETDGEINIPLDFTGTELSVEPVGNYEKRAISLKAYWLDESGKEIVIDDGTWMINDEVYSETETEIHPGISYTVKFKYDPEKYFYEETQGELYSKNEQTGEIQFKEVEAINGIGSFRIRLHPYTAIDISNNKKKIESIVVTGRNDIDTNRKSVLIEKLKPGDVVSVTLDQDYKLLTNEKSLDYRSAQDNRFDIVISESDQGVIDLSTAKWGSKKISITVDENGFWEKLKNNYLSWIPFLNKDEVNSILTIKTGDEEYTYSDLLNAKTVKTSERDNLIITVDKEKLIGYAFVITVNNWKPIIVNSKSEKYSFSYTYDEITKIKIDLIED